MDERFPVHSPDSTDQDDDSPWPHPCHCQHVAAWMAGIDSKLSDALAAGKPKRASRRKPKPKPKPGSSLGHREAV